MRVRSIVASLFFLFFQIGCANVKLISQDRNKYKFCTNAGNKIAKDSDFDDAAAQQCGGKYRNISRGLEFFTDPKTPKLGGVLEVQNERHMCSVYECTK